MNLFYYRSLRSNTVSRLAAIITGFLLFISPAQAQNQCALTAAELKPVLTGIGKVTVPPKVQDNYIKEAVVLADGVTLSRKFGGCNHVELNFSWAPLKHGFSPGDPRWIAVAVSLLKQHNAVASEGDVFMEGLRSAGKPAPAPAGAKSHEFDLMHPAGSSRLIVTQIEGGHRLSLEYSFSVH